MLAKGAVIYEQALYGTAASLLVPRAVKFVETENTVRVSIPILVTENFTDSLAVETRNLVYYKPIISKYARLISSLQ